MFSSQLEVLNELAKSPVFATFTVGGHPSIEIDMLFCARCGNEEIESNLYLVEGEEEPICFACAVALNGSGGGL